MSSMTLPLVGVRPAFAAARRLARDPWPIADQALISGTNFLTMILVARGLGGPGEFGAFTLVYSALLFANVLQLALVTQPHNVLGTARRGRDYAVYTTSTAVSQLLLAGLEAGAALAVALWAYAAHSSWAPLLLALPPAIVAWQLQEFVRRVLYTEGRHGAAFVNDLISYGGQTLLIGAMWLADLLSASAGHRWLTGPSALYALAATSAAAVVLGAWQIRGSLTARLERAALAQNWRFGRWMAGSEILTWCSSIHMYLYLAAALLGTTATGDLKAAQVLFGPTRVLAYYLDTVLPIRFARMLGGGGERAMAAGVRSILAKVVPLLAGYCLVVAVLARPLLHWTFGAGYAGAATLLALYSAYAFLTYLQMVVAAGLKAQRATHHLFVGSLVGFVIALPLTLALIPRLGTSAVLLAMIAAAAFVTGMYLHALWRTLRGRTGAIATAQDPTAPTMQAPDSEEPCSV